MVLLDEFDSRVKAGTQSADVLDNVSLYEDCITRIKDHRASHESDPDSDDHTLIGLLGYAFKLVEMEGVALDFSDVAGKSSQAGFMKELFHNCLFQDFSTPDDDEI